MRTVPSDKYDKKELKKLKAEPWQIALLSMNPGYTSWGPHEDSMHVQEEHGWRRPLFFDSWADFVPQFAQDDYNEVVNFYFEIGRHNKQCEICVGSGYHPDARWISESFYRHSSPFANQTPVELEASAFLTAFSSKEKAGELLKQPLRRSVFPSEATLVKYGIDFRRFCESMALGDGYWNDKITEDEVEALCKSRRLDTHEWNEKKKKWERKSPNPSAQEVNAAQNGKTSMVRGHDGINRGILVEARCKRLGVPLTCLQCKGTGYVYTAPKAHVNLVLWVLHPRKGASRGVEVKNISEADLPAIYAYLKEANTRSVRRFARVVAKARGGR